MQIVKGALLNQQIDVCSDLQPKMLWSLKELRKNRQYTIRLHTSQHDSSKQQVDVASVAAI